MAVRNRATVQERTYVEGNTVRKVRVVQEQAPQRREPQREPHDPRRKVSRTHTVRRNQEKALQMDLPYVVMLTLAAICALYICVDYLHVQSAITGQIHNIEVLERDIASLQSENNALETRINTSVDLDEVYRIATQDLGMVYANKKQVILYERTESEYVRQYEDIPQY